MDGTLVIFIKIHTCINIDILRERLTYLSHAKRLLIYVSAVAGYSATVAALLLEYVITSNFMYFPY